MYGHTNIKFASFEFVTLVLAETQMPLAYHTVSWGSYRCAVRPSFQYPAIERDYS